MTPAELRHLILYGERSEEVFGEIPKGEAQLLWVSRPNRIDVERAKHGMYLRSAIIVIMAIMFIFFKHIGDGWILFLIIIGYEIAYYGCRKKICENEYIDAHTLHSEKVDKFIKSYFKEFQ